MREDKIQYSVVVPVYNSVHTIADFVKEIELLFNKLGYSFEIVLTDDNSQDGTYTELQKLSDQYSTVQVFHLDKNYGQMAATVCGIHHSRGEHIITIDDDFQYHPREIQHLIEAMDNSELEIIYGAPRIRKQGEIHNVIVNIVILFFDYIVLPKYRDINFYTSFRIMRRKLFFRDGQVNKDRNLFFFWEMPPEKSKSILVNHQARAHGESNQNVMSLLKLYRPQTLFSLIVLFKILAVILIAMAISSIWICGPAQRVCTLTLGATALGFSVLFVLLRASLNRFRRIEYHLKSE